MILTIDNSTSNITLTGDNITPPIVAAGGIGAPAAAGGALAGVQIVMIGAGAGPVTFTGVANFPTIAGNGDVIVSAGGTLNVISVSCNSISVLNSLLDQNIGTVDLDDIRVINGSNSNVTLGFSGVNVEVEAGSHLNMTYHMARAEEIESKHAPEAIIEGAVTGKFTLAKGAKLSLDSDTGFNIDINYGGHDYHLTTTSNHLDQDMLDGLIILSDNINGANNLNPSDYRYLDTIPKDILNDFVLSNLTQSEEYDPEYAAQQAAQFVSALNYALSGRFFESNAIAHSVAGSNLGSIAGLLPNIASFLSSEDTGIVAETAYFNFEPIFTVESIEAELNVETAAADLVGANEYSSCPHCGF